MLIFPVEFEANAEAGVGTFKLMLDTFELRSQRMSTWYAFPSNPRPTASAIAGRIRDVNASPPRRS